jgi:A nuclease family of the HNH/ENDO VII superfamily with conserved AHH
MDASGDYVGAARERTELIGDLISMLTNPRTPSAMRILERLGVDPAWFERTSQTQRAFRDAAISQEHRINPTFAHADMTLFEAHHTIPIKQFPILDELRVRLQAWGIDINAMDNAVMLPGRNAPVRLQGTYHALLSNDGYASALAERFKGIATAADARATLAAINNELRNGTFHFTPGKK